MLRRLLAASLISFDAVNSSGKQFMRHILLFKFCSDSS